MANAAVHVVIPTAERTTRAFSTDDTSSRGGIVASADSTAKSGGSGGAESGLGCGVNGGYPYGTFGGHEDGLGGACNSDGDVGGEV